MENGKFPDGKNVVKRQVAAVRETQDRRWERANHHERFLSV